MKHDFSEFPEKNVVKHEERIVEDIVNDSIEAKSEGLKLIKESDSFFLVTLKEDEDEEKTKVGIISFGPTMDLAEVILDHFDSDPKISLLLKMCMLKTLLAMRKIFER